MVSIDPIQTWQEGLVGSFSFEPKFSADKVEGGGVGKGVGFGLEVVLFSEVEPTSLCCPVATYKGKVGSRSSD
jgi:hypothetical protein